LTPRVFISYSHDSPSHKQWVLKLASDLRTNGADAVIDQWDLSPGDEISKFMESEIRAARRVIVVCSKQYVEKANSGQGGVGYERMIVTSELITDLGTKKFIPVIRNSGMPPVPIFLGYRLYIDFEDDQKYRSSLETLLRELLDAPDPGKPPIGPNPFDQDGKGEPLVGTSESLQSPTASAPPVDSAPPAQNEEIGAIVEKLKELLTQPSHELNLIDLVMPVAKETRDGIEKSEVMNYAIYPTKEDLLQRVVVADQATNKLAHLFAFGCRWADIHQGKTFNKALSRVVIIPNPTTRSFNVWENVARYPALRVMYAGGIAACANESFGIVRRLLVELKSRARPHEEELPLVLVLHQGAGFMQQHWKWLPGRERHFAPVSDYLEESLRPALLQFAINDEEVSEDFDRFEFFQALIYGDLNDSDSRSAFGFWAPLGSFMWRRRNLFDQTRRAIEQFGEEWKPLHAGLFSGSAKRASEMINKLEDFTGRVRAQLGIL
jgi:hypothetical protein